MRLHLNLILSGCLVGGLWACGISIAENHEAKTVLFASGGTQLAATLLLPHSTLESKTQHPAVVLVHGSGPSARSNPWTAAYANALVARGIAVLHPDKRGSGESNGDWKSATLDDLADDALAAVEYLEQFAPVDSERIGVMGFSQGGHVVPIAASRSSQVAFAVSVSGSVVPMMEQIEDELLIMARDEELSPAQAAVIREIHVASVNYALTGEGWEIYEGLLTQHANSPIANSSVFGGFPRKESSWKWAHLKALGNQDPLRYWKAVSAPALFLYGGKDENVDVRKSTEKLLASEALADKNFSVMFFASNGHALYREDAMDFLATWIKSGGAH